MAGCNWRSRHLNLMPINQHVRRIIRSFKSVPFGDKWSAAGKTSMTLVAKCNRYRKLGIEPDLLVPGIAQPGLECQIKTDWLSSLDWAKQSCAKHAKTCCVVVTKYFCFVSSETACSSVQRNATDNINQKQKPQHPKPQIRYTFLWLTHFPCTRPKICCASKVIWMSALTHTGRRRPILTWEQLLLKLPKL